MDKCLSDNSVMASFFQKLKNSESQRSHNIYLEWHAPWIEAKNKTKQKKPCKIIYARSIKFSSKVPWQMGASLIFTLTINSSTGFVYFEETFHFFFQDLRCE